MGLKQSLEEPCGWHGIASVPVTHLVNKYLLIVCCVPGTVLGTGEAVVRLGPYPSETYSLEDAVTVSWEIELDV